MIGAIQDNLRLLSLNASLKCAQVGGGDRVLNVIAQQLRDLTGELGAAAQSAAASLSHAGALASTSEEKDPGATAASEDLDSAALDVPRGNDCLFEAALANMT